MKADTDKQSNLDSGLSLNADERARLDGVLQQFKMKG